MTLDLPESEFDYILHHGMPGEVVRTPFGLRVIVARFGIWAAYEREPKLS